MENAVRRMLQEAAENARGWLRSSYVFWFKSHPPPFSQRRHRLRVLAHKVIDQREHLAFHLVHVFS